MESRRRPRWFHARGVVYRTDKGPAAHRVRRFRSAILGVGKPRIWAMLFSDPWFLFVFLPGVLAGAILVRRLAGARAVLGFLVLASVFFYGWWNPIYLPLL